MPTDPSQIQWFVQQGIGFALAAFIFFLYRKDSITWANKQTETAQAFMAFGEKYAVAATQQANAMLRQSEILDRIERHLALTAQKTV